MSPRDILPFILMVVNISMPSNFHLTSVFYLIILENNKSHLHNFFNTKVHLHVINFFNTSLLQNMGMRPRYIRSILM